MCAVLQCMLPPASPRRHKPVSASSPRTVKDLVAGADIRFTERGQRDLKGLAKAVDLFAAAPAQPA